MSIELKVLIYKISKATSIPAYQIVAAVKKTLKSGRINQKQIISIFKKLIS